jgi:O-antigen/teichoic acid export membrane protein
MIAVGKTRVVLRQAIAQVLMTIVLIAIGSFFGLVGVMLAITLRAVVVAAYNVYALHKEIGLEAFAVLGVLAPPTGACIAMVVAVETFKWQYGGDFTPVVELALLVGIGGLTYGAVLILGDIAGLWRGYVRGAVGSLGGVFVRRSGLSPKTTPA